MPIVTTLRRLTKNCYKFEASPRLNNKFQASVGYRVRPCLKQKSKNKNSTIITVTTRFSFHLQVSVTL